jgi:hypothetical protein
MPVPNDSDSITKSLIDIRKNASAEYQLAADGGSWGKSPEKLGQITQ